jgi:hypothetical protein
MFAQLNINYTYNNPTAYVVQESGLGLRLESYVSGSAGANSNEPTISSHLQPSHSASNIRCRPFACPIADSLDVEITQSPFCPDNGGSRRVSELCVTTGVTCNRVSKARFNPINAGTSHASTFPGSDHHAKSTALMLCK